MSKHGKRFRYAKEKIPAGVQFKPDEAVQMVKELASAKFDESVDVSTCLGVDPKRAEQVVRGTVVLPHGTGKSVRVLVIAQGEKETEAQEAGADYVGMEELIEKVDGGWTDFDVDVASPEAMKAGVAKLGRVLGPRNLMPTPKAGTVTNDLGKAVAEVKAGRIEFKIDKSANLSLQVGKISFDPEKLQENAEAALNAVLKAKPDSMKGIYLLSASISTTMSPSVKLDTKELSKLG